MGTKYTTEAISGYNSSPPSDDATQSEANKVKWSTHKNKLGDPLKTQVENIDTKLVAMADIGSDAKTANYTTVSGDHQKTLEITASPVTITLLAVASASTGYSVTIKNNSGGTVDVDATGSETIDGSTSVVTLADMETLVVQLNNAATGYISLQQVTLTGGAGLASANTFTKTQTLAKGADVASAAALTLGTDGNSFDITGTTTITSIGTLGIGTHVTLHFDGILTLTHHATDLVLPSAANITTAAGDIAIFYEYASGDWRLVSFASKPPKFRGCLAYASSVTSVVNAAYTKISLQAEDYDTDSIHDNATNNTRLTVPSGVTRVRLTGQVGDSSAVDAVRYFRILKNSADTYTGQALLQSYMTQGSVPVQIITPVLTVAAADYFELSYFQATGGTINSLAGGNFTWFAMEIIE